MVHSPDYRRTFAEFLKIDFPRIPYPPSSADFAHVSEKGEALRRLHLMEAPAIGDTPFAFIGEGDDVVAAGYPNWADRPTAANPSPRRAARESPSPAGGEGRVYINPDQFFDAVPAIIWDFPIGGYRPAQKWLKDRRGRVLSWDNIGHYQKIIKILGETDRIMGEIVLPIAD